MDTTANMRLGGPSFCPQASAEQCQAAIALHYSKQYCVAKALHLMQASQSAAAGAHQSPSSRISKCCPAWLQ